jgi:hypothetical protein
MDHFAVAELAIAMGLLPSEAVALPSVISRSAVAANVGESRMVSIARESEPVRNYLAEVCRKVSKELAP